MAKYPDPAKAFEEGMFLNGMKDLPKPGKKATKTKKPFTPCKGCPTPYQCKSAGQCKKKAKK